MHAYYTATVEHEDGSTTQFLALDKPLPKREWILPFEFVKDENGKVTMNAIPWKSGYVEHYRKPKSNLNWEEILPTKKYERKHYKPVEITKSEPKTEPPIIPKDKAEEGNTTESMKKVVPKNESKEEKPASTDTKVAIVNKEEMKPLIAVDSAKVDNIDNDKDAKPNIETEKMVDINDGKKVESVEIGSANEEMKAVNEVKKVEFASEKEKIETINEEEKTKVTKIEPSSKESKEVKAKVCRKEGIPKITYDLEWAAILKVTEPLMSFTSTAEYSKLMSSDPCYKNYISFDGKGTSWGITHNELNKLKKREMEKLEPVIEGKEVFQMNRNDEDGCNMQTKKFMNLIGIDSKYYKEDKTDEKGAEELDNIEFC